jgi:ABC-2 type transport system permease protein
MPQLPSGLSALSFGAVVPLRDGWTITRREFGHIRREPGRLVAAVVFPALMVLLFGYVFGSAISVPGGGYREYLMPGLFAMTSISGVMVSALLISKDVDEGVMDRFRSMPMARSGCHLAAPRPTCSRAGLG